MTRPLPQPRSNYRHFTPLQTRWMDNDIYGHVNNVTYYSYFDTAVNQYLIEQGALDIEQGEVIGLVVETGCQYFAAIAFPDALEIGVRVAHMGRSSARYEVGIFKQGDTESRAAGHFVHVYVDRQTRRPVPLPEKLRNALGRIAAEPQSAPAD